jgi:Winged helix-turn-helix DNA-binding
MRKIDLTNFRVATSETARQINRRIALNFIRRQPRMSRADLARRSGLQRSTVSAIVDQLTVGIGGVALTAQSTPIPHLRKQGGATQLVVDGRPFLIRGGELGNSSASNLDYLAPHWTRFRARRLNTILAPSIGIG